MKCPKGRCLAPSYRALIEQLDSYRALIEQLDVDIKALVTRIAEERSKTLEQIRNERIAELEADNQRLREAAQRLEDDITWPVGESHMCFCEKKIMDDFFELALSKGVGDE